MYTINWQNATAGTPGTPVDRRRLMGMQGFFPGRTTITKNSDTLTTITETSAEGTCTTKITKNASNRTTIEKTFVAANGQTIRQTTQIIKNGNTTSIIEATDG